MKNYELDQFYEELEVTELNEVSDLLNNDGLEQYYEDYVNYEKDLTNLIKDKK